jgi:squalene-hopene/tetraprenyl-beta-curcumene cyclase
LRCRGYAPDHPILISAAKHLDDLMIMDQAKQQIRLQPCHSPVWDTGIAAYALTEAGLDQNSEPLQRCAQWLVSKEVRVKADWSGSVKYDVEPSGWYFEFYNEFYPDVDDTAMVSMALRQIGGKEALAAGRRGVDQVMALQNDDGGWAAFDRTVDRPILEHVPFADHNAIQDPSCPDITGRTLECLGHHGYTVTHPSIQQAINFIKHRQHPDGCWFGRWGINYVYGTWQVLCGVQMVAQDMTADWIVKGAQWLRSVQKPDGSFGESADTYEDESTKGQGPSTASQTAWGTMGMMAVYGPQDDGVIRGIKWLLDHQEEAGNWEEQWFTGTGFPKVFYLRYHLYRLYFPIMCIGRWLKLQGKIAPQGA